MLNRFYFDRLPLDRFFIVIRDSDANLWKMFFFLIIKAVFLNYKFILLSVYRNIILFYFLLGNRNNETEIW